MVHRVLIRYSFDDDDGTVTTNFWNALAELGFQDAGTGLKRADSLKPAQLEQFLQLAAQYCQGKATSNGTPVGVDHFIIVIESL